MIVGPINSGLTAGGAGVATANADSPTRISGYVVGVYVKYNGSPPNTTDVTVRTKGTSPAPPTQTILAIADAATDGWFQPRSPVHTAASGAAISDAAECLLIDDYVNVLVAQADNGDSVDVWLQVEPV